MEHDCQTCVRSLGCDRLTKLRAMANPEKCPDWKKNNPYESW